MTARVWLFDLDNTLHNASPHIFPHINRAMTAYVMKHLGLAEVEADALRMAYWRRYGATLTGLMRHHGVDPHHFLWETHQFPQLHRQLVFDGALKAMLRRLPGRKIVFSNAPSHYADAVLKAMGVHQCFEQVWCLEQLRFVPKPFPQTFRRLLHRERLHAVQCVMVEDSIDNLRTARRLGMKTVLVSPAGTAPAWVDVAVKSVRELPRQIGRL